MIHEVVVVEGICDRSAVLAAVEADLICTGGFAFGDDVIARLVRARDRRGLIVLTDPDRAGEQIRRRVEAIAGRCKHAWIPAHACTRGDDVGVEHASPEAIRGALQRARCTVGAPRRAFAMADLDRCGLAAAAGARARRTALGAALGIGYGNAKQLLCRLNGYGVTRAEFDAAVAGLAAVPQDGGR